MKPLNVLIQPRSGGPSGSLVSTRFHTGGSGMAGGLGGNQWESAIVRRPRLTLDLFSPALDGKTQTAKGDLVLNVAKIKQTDATVLYWQGAPITIYDVTDGDLTTAPVEFTGYVRSASYDVENDQLLLTFEVSTEVLDKPLLNAEFTGGGGLAGTPEFRGKKMPAGFGVCQNVEPVWFDPTNNIGMIDGYGNCTAITSLFEGGNDFGAKVADYATYAALLAAITGGTIKPGRWGTCVALGLIGLGAPPYKTITADATFGTNRPGAMMQRVLTTHAGVAGGSVDTAAFTALDVAVNRPVHYWTNQDRTCRDLLEAIGASCNGNPVVNFQGKYSVVRAFGGSNIGAVDRITRVGTPRWTKWRALDPDTPTWRMSMRAERPGVVLDVDQIMYANDVIDLGVWSNTTTYRQGNLVWSAAGAQFLFINATPTAAAPLPVLPATTTAFWQQTKPAPVAGDLLYADGTTIQALQPPLAGTDNRVRLSLMEKGTRGYTGAGTVTPTSPLFASAFNGIPYVRAAGNWTAASGNYVISTDQAVGFRIPVTVGERIHASCGMQAVTMPAGTTWAFYINYLDSAGAFLSNSLLQSGSGVTGFNQRVGGFSTVPANAVYAYLQLWLFSNTATSGAWDFLMAQPMLCSVGVGQTVAPVFTPGPSSDYGADVTGDNVTQTDANRVRFSKFERGTLGWFVYDGSAGTGAPSIVSSGGINFIHIAGSYTAANQTGSVGSQGAGDILSGYTFQVTPLERLFVGAQIGTVQPSGTCTTFLRCWFYDSAGGGLGAFDAWVGTGTFVGPQFKWGFVTVPATAKFGIVQIICTNGGVGTTGAWNMDLGQPMVCGAAATQTIAPAFNAGPSSTPGADVTGDNVAQTDANRVRFSRFERGLQGWIGAEYTTAAPTLTTGVQSGKSYFKGVFNFTANGQTIGLGTDTANFPGGAGLIACNAGERLYVGAGFAYSGAPAGSTAILYIGFLNSSGSEISRTAVFTGVGTGDPFDQKRGGFVTAPAGTLAAFLRFDVMNGTGGAASGVYIQITEPIVAGASATQTVAPAFNPGPSHEISADVTKAVPAPNESLNFSYNGTTGAAIDLASGATRDILFRLKDTLGGLVTSGVTWTYTVVNGTVNGFTSASGPQTMSVSGGVGTLNVASLGSTANSILVTATYGSAQYPWNGILQKTFTQSGTGGGGGGGTTDFNATSFTTNPTLTTTFQDVTGWVPGSAVSPTTLNAVISALPSGTGTGTWTVELRIMKNVGGTPTQVGTTQSASSDKLAGDPAGEAAFNYSVASSGSFQFRLEMRVTVGSRAHTISGSFNGSH